MEKAGAFFLIFIGAVGILGIIIHVICNDFGLCEACTVSGPQIVFAKLRIDCFTWWGKCLNLLMASICFALGIRLLRKLQKTS